MTARNISAENLKSVIEYDQNTGVFKWIVSKSRARIGDESGSIRKMKGGVYRVICIDQKTYLAHRLAFLYMTGNMPKNEVDHINHNGLDNRWENLRDVTRGENKRNCSAHKKCKTGVTGVFRRPENGTYRAYLQVNGKRKYLGVFKNIEDAKESLMKARKEAGYHENHGTKSRLSE